MAVAVAVVDDAIKNSHRFKYSKNIDSTSILTIELESVILILINRLCQNFSDILKFGRKPNAHPV